jgi:Na+/proline symporter
MPASSLEGTSSAPLLPAARSSPKRKLEKAADILIKRCGSEVVHLLYGLHVATSYLLMLAAMTYNIGVFLAVCTGAVPRQPSHC